LGRIDEQVKIRGFRLELGEIEQQLLAFDAVKSALVLAREDQLVAYVVGDAANLRIQLETVLPAHMIPSYFIELDELPLTANGKVDSKALPAPQGADVKGEYIAPTTTTEVKLSQIWAELLKLDADTLSNNANFFESGGHSLLSVRLVGEVLSQMGVELAIRDVFDHVTLSALAAKIDNSCAQNTRNEVVAIDRSILIPQNQPQNQPQSEHQLPASFAQQRLWFIDQMDGGSTQYNMPGALRFKGDFSEDIIEQAFTRIIERHEPLRTVFVNTDDGVEQLIRNDFEFTLNRMTLHGSAQQLQALAQQDATRTFNLEKDLMLSAAFIRLAVNEGTVKEGVLLFNMHHIASDGWSMGLLVREFWTQYDAIRQGLPNPFEPLAIQYADYAVWQKDSLDSDSQLDYWQQQLAGIPQVHSLGLDRARPKDQTFNGKRYHFNADGATLEALNKLAITNNATLFMVLHGAFALLLSRHSASTDIVMGVPVANRMQKALEDVIGFFVNTLVLRADCSQNPSFADYLQQIKTTNLDAQANQDVPFEYLVDRLNPERSTAHAPLFQIMFSMDTNEKHTNENHTNEQDIMAIEGLTISPLAAQSNDIISKFELMLNASQTDNQLQFSFDYNTDLFDANTIETLASSLLNLLSSIANNAQTPIHDLAMLSQPQQDYLLKDLNDTQRDFPDNIGIAQWFEQQVAQTPDGIALIAGDEQLTYSELNSRANRLAHYLRSKGVKPDTLVGLHLERSFEMVIGIYGILKAGGAYVPLDPNYPQSRLDYMQQDSNITLALTEKELQQGFSAYSDENPQCITKPSDLAYVIYTSGSTGQPKGVMVEHRALVNRIDWMQNQYQLSPEDAVLQKTPFSFDVSVWEFLWQLGIAARFV
ncbi:MAG: AMP-binding protein, partial [Algicola sp.]|nr:AMP-binding protein [Algicola sp.]